ncbi:MAG TPA: DUF6164 family protein [Gammaproteobacteria bacterium]
MTTLLIRLNGAPDDEVAELRQLLSDHAIDFYETDAGRWGISVAALWLRDANQLEQARTLIADYQLARTARMRSEYEARRREGRHETLLSRLVSTPLQSALYLLLIVVVLYFSLMPFISP